MGKSKLSTSSLMKVLVYVLFASVLIPLINTQMLTIEGDTGNYSATEILLAGIVTTFIILGVVYGIVKEVL